MKEKMKCLHCDKSVTCRGCCHVCYQAIRASIRFGFLTEADAVEKGLLAVPEMRGGGRKKAVWDALEKATGKNRNELPGIQQKGIKRRLKEVKVK